MNFDTNIGQSPSGLSLSGQKDREKNGTFAFLPSLAVPILEALIHPLFRTSQLEKEGCGAS